MNVRHHARVRTLNERRAAIKNVCHATPVFRHPLLGIHVSDISK